MKIKYRNIGLLLILFVSVLFTACENEKWNEHYRIDPSIVSEKNLWETIESNPEYSIFAWAVKKTGFDKMLSSSQMFSIWLPDNIAAAHIDTTDNNIDKEILLREFVQNHIARFSYPASGLKESRILLMNKKVITFKHENSDFLIEGIRLKTKNIVTANGIIHIIETPIPFFSNLWEYLSKDQELDSIKNYLFSFNELYFDANKSIPGDVNENGETVYLDSVIYNYNIMFRQLGAINNEDSTYSVIFPTNSAWVKGYDDVKSYYNYFSTPETQITADTLQRKHTLRALTQDLVFSHTKQQMDADTLISTNRNKFYKPFEQAFTSFPASNGMIYMTNEIKYNSWESWNKEIKIEAERSSGRINTWSSLYERTYNDIELVVSNNRFVEVTPTTSSVNPTVTFEVPNTLSGELNPDSTINKGTAYNVYCIFAPNKLKTPSPKPNKVTFTLTFQSSDRGRVVNVNFTNQSAGFITDPEQMTKVLIASKVTFPYAEYGLETPNVKLKVNSNVSSKETATYTRDMLIDCIIFEPVR
ncbi:MAG: fasciclin domain-containing protein [Paludibacteraceae bacterium]|nr:fasciclin domain-containing protein [Paludibacteraceae bacterium]